MRLSALRTSTSPLPTCGGASTSLETRARQRTSPFAVSTAMTSPASVATAAVRRSAPTPLESRVSTDVRQRSSPLATSKRASVPSRAAA